MTTTVEPDTRSSYGTIPGDPSKALTIGGVGAHLTPAEVTEFVVAALAGADLDGKRVCLVVPDGTRTCPLPLLLRAAYQALAGRVAGVTVVIALGTHQGMSEEQLAHHLGYPPGASGRCIPAGRSSTTSPGDRRRSPRSG